MHDRFYSRLFSSNFFSFIINSNGKTINHATAICVRQDLKRDKKKKKERQVREYIELYKSTQCIKKGDGHLNYSS
jgi:hypothetical protein